MFEEKRIDKVSRQASTISLNSGTIRHRKRNRFVFSLHLVRDMWVYYLMVYS